MTSVKNHINLINKYDRVVVLVDMDCFYCQVEEKLNPELTGKPIAVVQYNEWKGGGIIAVNYPARAKGVTRHMRGDEAKEHCPDIQLCRVPNVRGKADLTKYRDAGKEVAAVLQTFTPLLERASVDEAYLDITDTVTMRLRELNEGKFKLDPSKFTSTFAVGFDNMGDFVLNITNNCNPSKGASSDSSYSENLENESENETKSRKRSDIKLLIGAAICNDIRAAVKEKTGYDCSAGIAHNKILAKLTAGMNKPNKQTILPLKSIHSNFTTLPICKVLGLGGKFGEQVCEVLKIKYMAELVPFSKEELIKRFDEKNGNWLYLIARGIDLESVTPRYTSKSIGCSKKFPGKSAITGIASLNHWLLELSTEICERLEKDSLEYNRTAKQMTITFTQQIGPEDISSARSVPLNYYKADAIAREALDVIKRNTSKFFRPDNVGVLNNSIKFLSISVGKFENNPDKTKRNTLEQMFKNHVKKQNECDKDEAKSEIKNIIDEPMAGPSNTSLDEIIAIKKQNRFFEFEKKELPPAKPQQCLSDFFKTSLENTNESESDSGKLQSNSDTLDGNLNRFEKQDKEIPEQNAEQKVGNNSNEMLENSSTSQSNLKESDCSTIDIESVQKNDDELSQEEIDIMLPEIEPEFVKCEQCKRKILKDDLLSHQDYHFALQISQQQREEFRKQNVPKAKPTQVPKHSNNKSDKKLMPIDIFFKKQDEQDRGNESDEETVKCEECLKDIKVSVILEHSDYHLAKKVQEEMRKEMNSSSITPTIGVKRKRSTDDKMHPNKVKPLTNFFTKLTKLE